MKSNVTMYLAAGAMLDGSTKTSDYAASGHRRREHLSTALVHFYNVMNANILGRGVVDGEGTTITGGSNDTPSFKINAAEDRPELEDPDRRDPVRDPVFWNTLAYMSDQVTIQNYKVINRRPTSTTYNQTDGVDFDASSNCTARQCLRLQR